MSRKLVLMLTLTLLIGTLSVASNVQRAKASETVHIRADGSIDPPIASIYTTDNITYTLTGNISSDTDGIVVERDNVTIDGAGYTLQGPGGPEYPSGIDLTGGNNITIKNVKITAFYHGILLGSSSNNSVSGNNITANSGNSIELVSSSGNSISGNNITANNETGIYIDSSSGNSISGNNITANSNYGIYLDSSSSNSISGNNITANTEVGIWLGASSNNSVSGNTFTNDGLYVWSSYQNIVEGNTVNGRPLVYLEGVSNYTVADAGQVVLVSCENIRVEGFNLSRTIVGIELWETGNSTISGNNITNTEVGIALDSSSGNSISGNNITNNYGGIYLYYSSSNNVSGNNLTANNNDGILLYSSSNNSVSGNNITANNMSGIELDYSSNNNSISGNNITANNRYGIGLLFSTSGNTVYHNNFIDNTFQAYSSDPMSVWDDGYPSGGNYWSDYNGTDSYSGSYQNETRSDGIGDTPYIIDANDVDNYPLMAPLNFFDAGTWNDTTYYMDIVSNSTVSHFHFDPDEGAFASFWVKTTPNETFDFCRVAIPKDLLWVEDGWTVLYGSYPLSYKTFSDENYTYLYFTYTNPSSHGFTSFTTVTINGTHVIPEFPSFSIPALFMIATLLAVIVYRKKYVHAKFRKEA